MSVTADLSAADGPIVYVSGELDMAAADELRLAGFMAVDAIGLIPLTLDLAGVTFMDSTALGALIEIRAYAADAAKQVLLSNVTGPVLRIMKMTGLDSVFTLEPEV
jgi:anti-anti-sigma factor